MAIEHFDIKSTELTEISKHFVKIKKGARLAPIQRYCTTFNFTTSFQVHTPSNIFQILIDTYSP